VLNTLIWAFDEEIAKITVAVTKFRWINLFIIK
jgi:hypothetical protein